MEETLFTVTTLVELITGKGIIEQPQTFQHCYIQLEKSETLFYCTIGDENDTSEIEIHLQGENSYMREVVKEDELDDEGDPIISIYDYRINASKTIIKPED